jgi:hypothetical protein
MEDNRFALTAPRLRLALMRDELAAAEQLLAAPPRFGFSYGPGSMVTWLDGLAAVRDQLRVEEAAPPLVQRGTYAEPFALRALGIVRDDEMLVSSAQSRFAAMGLDWHAAQTPSLLRAAQRH